MADGFIVRRGGVEAGELIPAPTITLVSKTTDSITFTLTNNSIAEQDVTFGLTTPPTTTTITLASQATSGNQTFSNLDDDTTFIIFAQAADGVIAELSVTTDALPVFTAATGGTTLEYNSGGKRFRSHTFTSNGNFVVSTAGNGDRNQVDYLIIAGGGGGGTGSGISRGAGGGGAGGYRTTFGTQGGLGTLDSKVTITTTSFGVTVGSGGGTAAFGSNSSVAFASTITSTGGGQGGGGDTSSATLGGSGGGGGSFFSGDSTGGNGLVNQGFDGGDALATSAGAGGGGAGQLGQSIDTNNDVRIGEDGGNGLSSIIRTGSAETRAGGAGGGKNNGEENNNVTGGTGGTGGGGNGGEFGIAPTAGTANTGSGGGGGAGRAQRTGALGGSGIVVIRYEIATV